MKKNFIPVNKPLIHRDDISTINKTLKEGWVSAEGPNLNFEQQLLKRQFH